MIIAAQLVSQVVENNQSVTKPNVNIAYGPYQEVSEGLSNVIQIFGNQSNIPLGLTIAVGNENDLREYWWTGSAFVQKCSGTNVKIPSPEGGGDSAAFQQEIDDIIDDINKLKTDSVVHNELQNEVDNFNARCDSLQDDINTLSAGLADLTDLPTIELVETYWVMVFTDSEEQPATPTSTYNFETQTLSDLGIWSRNIPEERQYTIWFSYRTFRSKDDEGVWSTPVPLLARDTIIENIQTTAAYPVSLYITSDTKPFAPTDSTYDTETKGLKLGTADAEKGWRLTPEGDTGIIWVSYNNFLVSDNGLIEATGWEEPVLYLNIKGVLEDAETTATNVFNQIKEDALTDIGEQVTSATNAAADAKTAASDAEDRINEIIRGLNNGEIDAVGLQTQINELGDQLRTNGWSVYYEYSVTAYGNSENAVDRINSTELCYENGEYLVQSGGLAVTAIAAKRTDGTYFIREFRDSENNIIESIATSRNGDEAFINLTTDSNGIGEFYNNVEQDVWYYALDKKENSSPQLVYSEEVFDALTGKWHALSYLSTEEQFKKAALSVTYEGIIGEVMDFNKDSGDITASMFQQLAGKIKTQVLGLENASQTVNATTITQDSNSIVLTALKNAYRSSKSSILDILNDAIEAKVTSLENDDAEGTSMSLSTKQIMFQAFGGKLRYNIEQYTTEDGRTLSGPEIAYTTVGTQYSSNGYFVLGSLNLDGLYPLYASDSEGNIKKSGDDPYILTYTSTWNEELESSITSHPSAQIFAKATPEVISDDSLQQSIMSIVKDRISLQVGNQGLMIQIDENGNGETIINTDQVNITGQLIAAAIGTESAIINDRTYLNSDGSVWMAMGQPGASAFNTDGSGYLAGGLINWGSSGVYTLYSDVDKSNYITTINGTYTYLQVKYNNTTQYVPCKIKSTTGSTTQLCLANDENIVIGYDSSTQELKALTPPNNPYSFYSTYYSGANLNIKGIINAYGGNIGGWTIGDTKLFSTNTNSNIAIMPQAIYSFNSSITDNSTMEAESGMGWCLYADGRGFLAKNQINWTADGTTGQLTDRIQWSTNTVTLQASKGQIEISPDSIHMGWGGNSASLYITKGVTTTSDASWGSTGSQDGLIYLGGNDKAQFVLNENKERITMSAGTSKLFVSNDGIMLSTINHWGKSQYNADDAGSVIYVSNDTTNKILINSTYYSNAIALYSKTTNTKSYQVFDGRGNIILASQKGPQIYISDTLSLNSGNDEASPYIVLDKDKGITITTSDGQDTASAAYINVIKESVNTTTKGFIELVAGAQPSDENVASFAVQTLTSKGITLHAGATRTSDSNEFTTYISDIYENISTDGIGLFAGDSVITLTPGRDADDVIDTEMDSRLKDNNDPNNRDLPRITLSSVDWSEAGRVEDLKAFISVTENGIYIGGPKVVIGSDVNVLATMTAEEIIATYSNLNSGITSKNVSKNTDIVIWSGATGSARATAPFRVDLAGNVYANNFVGMGVFSQERTLITGSNYTQYLTKYSSNKSGQNTSFALDPLKCGNSIEFDPTFAAAMGASAGFTPIIGIYLPMIYSYESTNYGFKPPYYIEEDFSRLCGKQLSIFNNTSFESIEGYVQLRIFYSPPITVKDGTIQTDGSLLFNSPGAGDPTYVDLEGVNSASFVCTDVLCTSGSSFTHNLVWRTASSVNNAFESIYVKYSNGIDWGSFSSE